jgi:single-strand DNA-binding protein
MFQQFTAIGNLGNEPEMKYLPNGVPVTSFSLAINKSWVDANGQKQEKTLWVRVSAWRKLAEVAAQYLHKGSKILIVGELEPARAYIDREGNPRASLEVTANTIKFLSAKNEGADGPGQAGQAADATSEGTEDIPF